MKMKPRDVYDAGCDEWEDDIETEPFHVTHLGEMLIMQRSDNNGLEQTLREQRWMLALVD